MKDSGTLLKTWRMTMEEIKNFYVRKNEADIVWNQVGQEIIIILTREKEEKVLRLNKTARFIWEHCDGRKTVQEVVKDLCLKYDIDEVRAMDDAVKLLTRMKEMQLIILSTNPS
jgi:3-deoxy-D-manno-octulosonate 8-phosphate phosphatase KdsC-like HAD superfamily phosphatase